MAGDWIKFELATMDKPEVCQIADLADIDQDAVVGKLLRVWAWFDQQTEKGNAPSVSKKLLDRSVGITGFCEYMKSVGWMSEAEGVISLPHFERHNGKTGKNRALTAKRVASHKTKGNAANVTSALPKEEKRREDQHHSLSAGEVGLGSGDPKAETFEGLTDPEELPEGEPEQPIDPKAPVEMTLNWMPDANLLKTYCVHFGVSTDLFTKEAVAPFTAHHETAGTLETQAKWVSLLVRWVKGDTSRASNIRPFPVRRQSAEPDFDSSAWAEGLVVNP